MKALLDQRDQLVLVVPPVHLDPLAQWETLERGVPQVNPASQELTVSLDLLAPPSCCHSGLVRAVEIRAQWFQLRRLKRPPSCPRLGWL